MQSQSSAAGQVKSLRNIGYGESFPANKSSLESTACSNTIFPFRGYGNGLTSNWLFSDLLF